MIDPVTNSCSIYSCFDSPAKKAALITTLVLAAIGLLSIGTLGLFASLNPGSLVVLENLGTFGSAGLLAVGIVALCAASALNVVFCKPGPARKLPEPPPRHPMY